MKRAFAFLTRHRLVLDVLWPSRKLWTYGLRKEMSAITYVVSSQIV